MKYYPRLIVSLFAISITIFLTACNSNDGAIIRVPEDISTISAAISAADAGSTVLISTGVYSETGTINIDKDLVLASIFINTKNPNDITNTVIKGDGSNDLFIVTSDANVRIEGLTIENTNKPITVDVGEGVIRSNVLRDNNSDSISNSRSNRKT